MGCEVQICDLRLHSHASLASQPATSDPDLERVNLDLVHTNPNILNHTPGLLNVGALRSPLRIGYWAWELEAFPQGWDRFFTFYDEIWCPSAFAAQSLLQRSPIPVVAIPHLPDWSRLDTAYHQRRRRVAAQPAQQKPVRLLTCFDYWSTTARKNPAAVIAAFQQAFPSEQATPVELLIKTSSADQFPREHNRLRRSTSHDPRIQWCDQLLEPEAMLLLLASADVLVSLHRAEGFGLVLADAMALGIPVIATGYSGNLEFMPPDSAALVPWELVPIESSTGDYPRGCQWAEPSLGHAARWMRQLVDQPQLRLQLGERGRRAVQERLGLQRLGPLVQQRLGTLLLQPSRRELQPAQPLQ